MNAVYYIPLWIIICIVVVLYSIVIGFLIRHSRRNKYTASQKSVYYKYYKLVAYPAIFLCSWIFPTIRRMYGNFLDATNIVFVLALLQVLSLRAQGSLNTIVYLLEPIDGHSGLGKFIRTLIKRYRGEHIEEYKLNDLDHGDGDIPKTNDLSEFFIDKDGQVSNHDTNFNHDTNL